MSLKISLHAVILVVPIFICLLGVTQTQLLGGGISVSFDESCGSHSHCIKDAFLSCINHSCKCINPDEMSFDNDKRICVVMHWKKCVLSGRAEKLDCVKNAFCNQEDICVPKGIGGKNCTSDTGCRSDLLLSCRSGICNCDSSISILNPITEKCGVPAGSSCKYVGGRNKPCVGAAKCDLDAVNDYQCICERGYLKSKSSLCLPTHGENCYGGIPCHEDFFCVNGKCQCPFPSHQYFNATDNRCTSYVLGPCSATVAGRNYSFPCTINAECIHPVGHDEKMKMECLCREGWIESDGRSCKATNGQPCANAWFRRIGMDCDSSSGLECRDETCSCPQLQIYDEGQSKCRGVKGAICSPQQVGFCIDGARCIKFRVDGLGVCR